MKFILGKKIGMTEIFEAGGKRIPVTMIEAGPCRITQIKTEETDGYCAAQLGFGQIGEKKVKKGQAKKPFRFIRECGFEAASDDLKAGNDITAAVFQEGDSVKISGLTKGKGYQGAVKKHGFKGRLACTHGTKHELRNVGSVGMGGAAIRKGRKMPGRMGSQRITVRNAKVVKVDAEKNLIAVRGAVPGNKGTLLEIKG
jgi:large subunit ribosomal protein L3